MNRNYLPRISNLLLLVWFLCIPLFWKFDLARGTVNSYDAFSMAPAGLFHLVVFYSIFFFSIYFNRISFMSLLLANLYFPLIQLTNYPYLTIRDVYLHSGPVKNILASGQLSYSEYMAGHSFFVDAPPESYPLPYNLHASLSMVTGLDVVTTNYILYFALLLAFTLILYLFARFLFKNGYRLAGYSAVLFSALFFNHLLDNFHHFSRTSMGFTFLLLFVFLFISARGGSRSWYLLLLLVPAATFLIHPFQSFALLGFVIAYFLFVRISRQNLNMRYVLLLITGFLGWSIFGAPKVIELGVSWLRSAEVISPITETLITSIRGPWWGVILREIFKYSLGALVALAAFSGIVIIVFIWGHRKINPVSMKLFSLLPMSLIVFLVLIALPEWQISRFVSFVAFPAAFSSFLLIDRVISRRPSLLAKKLRFVNRKFLLTLLLLFITVTSAVVMVLRFEKNFYLGEIQHQSELYSLSFFSDHDSESTVTMISWRTCVYFSFFNYNLSHQTFRLWDTELKEVGNNETKLLLSEGRLIHQSQFVIRGIRDELDLYRFSSPSYTLNVLDEEILLPDFNQIYSNGYYTVFCRRK